MDGLKEWTKPIKMESDQIRLLQSWQVVPALLRAEAKKMQYSTNVPAVNMKMPEFFA